MNSVAEDIKDILEAESLGMDADNLFVGRMPDKPDECVVLYDTTTQPPQLTLAEEGAGLNYDSFQVQVRDTGYQGCWTLIKSIQDALHGRAAETWNGTLYTAIYCSAGPAFMEWDKNSRVHFIMNFNVMRR